MKRRSTTLFKRLMYERYRLNEEEKENDELFGGEEESKSEEDSSAEDDEGGSDESEDKPEEETDDEGSEDDNKSEDKDEADKDPAADLTDEEKEEIASKWAAEQASETGGVDGDETIDPDVLTTEIEKHLEKAVRAAEESAKIDLAKRVNFFTDKQGPSSIADAWWRKGLSTLLFEANEANEASFDVGEYAQHVSRFIFNYNKMLDIPFIIYTKAYDYIKSLYGEDIAEQFKSIMEDQYDIEFNEEETPTVYAVGAKPSGAAG
jgi:hypothetical protein